MKLKNVHGIRLKKFPQKLQFILDFAIAFGYDDTISWIGDGRAFRIHKQYKFFEVLARKWFKITKKKSFESQIDVYGFKRAGNRIYYHPKFLKDQPELSDKMNRLCIA